MSNPTLVLIDGHSLAFRAFHAIPLSLTSPSGELTNAVFGFTSMLLNVLRDQQPEYVAVAFDVGKTFRHEMFPGYKGHRERMPDEDLDVLRSIAARYRWTSLDHGDEALLSDEELYHLSTRAGTLTPEERAIVEGHVVATTRMLERLPYPKRLRNIPMYAGAHHEQVSGNGYPRKLAGDQIPLQGRIIGLADVLEALTAPDRPYKKPMPISQALNILEGMKTAGHIDPEIVQMFIEEKVYESYAENELTPEQRA